MLVRPFLKWPGGKFRLINILKPYLSNYTCLVEPFVGAGALFLNTHYPEVIINDINPDLMNVYQQLRTNHQQFISDAKKQFITQNNNAKRYYRIRERFNQSNDLWERAILFIFLNRHGFNGLCRYNLKGFYNVPFGHYQKPYFPLKELENYYIRSKNVTFYCENYLSLLNRFLKKPSISNMVFYCDPPYAPLTKTANFTGYAANRFTLEDQKQLALSAQALSKKGATVLISNHDTPFTREIYASATLQEIEVSRTISCHVQKRKKVKEIIACY